MSDFLYEILFYPFVFPYFGFTFKLIYFPVMGATFTILKMLFSYRFGGGSDD